MLPTDFEQANFTFYKPEGMTDEQCLPLRVWKGQVEDEDRHQVPSIISCWKLSYEDLQEIQKTGVVWLSVVGYSLPPVSVFTENPFKT